MGQTLHLNCRSLAGPGSGSKEEWGRRGRGSPEKSQHCLAWLIPQKQPFPFFSGNAGLIPSDRLGKADGLRDWESYCQAVVEANSSGISEDSSTGRKDS